MTDTTNIATLLAPQQLREAVVFALVEGRTFQRFARGDDQPEDLAVDLLRTTESGPVRNAVLAGLRDVWLLLQEALSQPDCNPDTPVREGSLSVSEIVSHFSALLNRAAPRELEALVYSLLEVVLRPEVDRVLYVPLVRAALAYAHEERKAPFWESQAVDELVSGWAFKALAQIDAEHPRVLRLLATRWEKMLARQTTVDPVLITNEIASKRKDSAAFRRELWRIVAPIARQMGQYDLLLRKWEDVTMQSEEKLALVADAATTMTFHGKMSAILRARALARAAGTQVTHKHVFYGGGNVTGLARATGAPAVYVQYRSRNGRVVLQRATRIAPDLQATGLSAGETRAQVQDDVQDIRIGKRGVERMADYKSLLPTDRMPAHIQDARSVELGNEPSEFAGKWIQTLQVNTDIEDSVFQEIADLVLRQAGSVLQRTYIELKERVAEKARIEVVLDY